MKKKNLKVILPLIILILLCVPVINSSIREFEQKKIEEEKQAQLVAKQKAEEQAEKNKKDAAEKIYLLGQFDPATRDDFAIVPHMYDISGHTIYLRKETLAAFTNMAEAAAKDNVTLQLASATRNFDYQKGIWDSKWEGKTLEDGENLLTSIPDGLERFKKILEYSAVPGTSRHHWGTDIDINGATVEYFETKSGERVYDWLMKNASAFGFCQTYTEKSLIRPTGYNEEKWHWSYLPLSRDFTQDYKRLITDADIKGFDGDEYVSGQDLINNYVLGINPECK